MKPMILDGKPGFGCLQPETDEEWKEYSIRESEYIKAVRKHFEECDGCIECRGTGTEL